MAQIGFGTECHAGFTSKAVVGRGFSGSKCGLEGTLSEPWSKLLIRELQSDQAGSFSKGCYALHAEI